MSANFDTLFNEVSSRAKKKSDANFDQLFDSVKQSKEPQRSSISKSVLGQTERTPLEHAGRIAGQLALGAAENALLPYEIATAPLASKDAQNMAYRENLSEDLERLLEKKSMGDWDEHDENLLKHTIEQIKDPRKSEKFVQTGDLGIRSLAEKATGLDLHPEGILEKAANWTGFLKKPANVKQLINLGTTPSKIIKAIVPGSKALRGLGAGAAIEMAEQNKFGPLGTMAAMIVGDLIGGGAGGLAKVLSHPKQALAKGVSKLSNTKSAIQKDLQEASTGKQFTKDLGTLTNNNMVQMIQARLAASGLTGKPLENLRKQMTKEIVQEYESIAKKVGEARFSGLHEAGEVGKEAIKRAQEADKAIHEKLFSKVNKRLDEKISIKPTEVLRNIELIERDLKPGSVKSPEQKVVLKELSSLKNDLVDAKGKIKEVTLKELINNKRALQEFVDYELQGGQKNRLKQIIREIDDAILEYGKGHDKEFLRDYVQANKKFQDHAKTFRNENLNKILRSEDPTTVMNKMNSVQGIKDLKNALYKTPEGKNTFDSLARLKLDNILGNNLKDGITEQLKAGKFFNALENPKNKQLIQELLSPEAFKRLVNLQKHVGKLAESAQKFFNASQSATASADLATVASIFTGLFGLFTGNPWIIGGLSSLLATKQLTKLIADPKFLKMVEEGIAASQNNNVKNMSKVAKNIMDYVREVAPGLIKESKENLQNQDEGAS